MLDKSFQLRMLAYNFYGILSQAAGMALPQSNMMSSIMSTTTGHYQQGTSSQTSGNGDKNQCLGQLLCMSSCKNRYTLGPVGHDGCRSCTCGSGSGKK